VFSGAVEIARRESGSERHGHRRVTCGNEGARSQPQRYKLNQIGSLR
jgi:hypothetical protein